MRIQHNIMAMNAYRNYNTNTSALSKNLEKLSSGYKINRAGDDAAGLAISEKMRAQITGLNAAQKNVKDGISLVKTAEGAMQEIQDMLNRMDYLATQSANGTYDNEVDRLNLQKEVNQLRSEIDRIADSANFNGIKLLDGKAGVNTTAFTNFKGVDSAAATDGKVNISDLLSAEDAGETITHMEGKAANQVNASAVIDLKDLAVNGVAAAADATTPGTASIDIKLGSKTFTVTLKNTNTSATANFNSTDIAAALMESIAADTDVGVSITNGANDSTNATNNNGIKIGDAVYKLTDNTNGTIKLELAGTFDDANNYTAVANVGGSAATTANDNDFTPDQADDINDALGFTVTADNVSGGTKAGEVVHNATNVTQAVAHQDATRAGIDLTLDETIVKQGNKLVIDGKEFTFELEDANNTAAGVINLAAEKAAGKDILHAAADKLSQQTEFSGVDDTARKWTIGTGKDNYSIHIEQTAKSTTGKELDTYEKLTGKISVEGTPTAAKGKGVEITVDPSKIAAGNKLNIDGKVYTFVKGAGGNVSADGKNIEVSMDGDALENLKAALGTDKYDVEIKGGVKDGEKIFTIRAKVGTSAEAAASKAPVITGEGLTLQIGDTSDSYNQLSVKIGDMHTTALNIADLDISNPEGASAAIKTIRDAINQVSGVRGDLGATQNRLEHTANNLSVMAENIQDAESTIRDTDVAEEMMAYTKNNILIQSAQAMLAQANAVPQGVLQLLG